MQSFSFIPLTASEKIFEYFFRKFYLLCNQSNSAIWTKFILIVKDYSRNISVKIKKIYISAVRQQKIADFHFSHYKSKETISFHSNHSSYPIGTKNVIIRSPTPRPIYRCYMWNMERIRLTASAVGEVV